MLTETVVGDLIRWAAWFDINVRFSGDNITIEVLQDEGWFTFVLPHEVGKVRLLMELCCKVSRWVPFCQGRHCLKTLYDIGEDRLRQISVIYRQHAGAGRWL